MKLTFSTFFLAVFLIGGLSVRAEDWTTIDGKVYPRIKVIKVERDAVTILYRDGGALIPLIMLPDDLQKQFHYDAFLAKAATDARDKADLENARALRAERQLILARKLVAMQAQQGSSANSNQTADTPPATYSDPSRHTKGDLIDQADHLQNNVSDDNHYPKSSLITHGPLYTPPADSNHYSKATLFGSDDPLNQ